MAQVREVTVTIIATEHGGGGRSSHGNVVRRVRLRIRRPRRCRGPGHRPVGQIHPARDSPSTYIVNVPSDEGVYSFPGMLRNSDRKDAPVGGTSWEGTCPAAQQSRPLCPPTAQLACRLPCGGGKRFRLGHRQVHPVVDDNYPAGPVASYHPFRAGLQRRFRPN